MAAATVQSNFHCPLCASQILNHTVLVASWLFAPLMTGEISSKGRLHKATKKSYLKDLVNLLIRVHHHLPKLPKATEGIGGNFQHPLV